jgi:hypothetical protein
MAYIGLIGNAMNAIPQTSESNTTPEGDYPMKKILITLAALTAMSGAALAEKSDDSHYSNQRNGGGFVMTVKTEAAPLAVSSSKTFIDIDKINDARRGDSSGGNK